MEGRVGLRRGRVGLRKGGGGDYNGEMTLRISIGVKSYHLAFVRTVFWHDKKRWWCGGRWVQTDGFLWTPDEKGVEEVGERRVVGEVVDFDLVLALVLVLALILSANPPFSFYLPL